METRRGGRHKTTSVFLAFALLLVGGAAAVSAAPDLFPAIGQAGSPNAARGVDGGDRITLNIPIGGLAPGAAIHGRHIVENTSAQPLRYALSSSSVNGDGKSLRDVVRVTIKTADPSSGPAASCDSFDGATLYSGRLGARSAGFGDPRIGRHAGDRLLAAGQREALCFEIEMPLDAGNEFQGATTASVWTIAMEQVDGNS
jgi:hypothetical protein